MPSSALREENDHIAGVLRSGAWLTEQRCKAYIVCLLIAYTIAIAWTLYHTTGLVLASGIPLGADFVSFWNAGRFAAQGDAAVVYDHGAFVQAQLENLPTKSVFPFFYPPHYLLGLIPFGLMSYPAAYATFMTFSFAAVAAVLCAMRPDRWTVLGVVAAPGFIVTLSYGQNSFLTTALLGAGLYLLDRKPWLAGVAFGALTIKPQLGLLIPIVLICGGYWRSIISAAVTGVAMIAATYLILGEAVFVEFLSASGVAMETLRLGTVEWERVISAYAAIRLIGGGDGLGWAAQVVVSLSAGILAGYVWATSSMRQAATRNAILVVCALLVTPYALVYDLFALLLPIVWLTVTGGTDGFRPWEITLLAIGSLSPIDRVGECLCRWRSIGLVNTRRIPVHFGGPLDCAGGQAN